MHILDFLAHIWLISMYINPRSTDKVVIAKKVIVIVIVVIAHFIKHSNDSYNAK
jgi:hypothetical protein